jgi:predicted nucleotidyltransferase
MNRYDRPDIGVCVVIRALNTERAAIAELCRCFHVRRLDLFGSAAREADTSDTPDIDLLVEYDRPSGSARH